MLNLRNSKVNISLVLITKPVAKKSTLFYILFKYKSLQKKFNRRSIYTLPWKILQPFILLDGGKTIKLLSFIHPYLNTGKQYIVLHNHPRNLFNNKKWVSIKKRNTEHKNKSRSRIMTLDFHFCATTIIWVAVMWRLQTDGNDNHPVVYLSNLRYNTLFKRNGPFVIRRIDPHHPRRSES